MYIEHIFFLKAKTYFTVANLYSIQNLSWKSQNVVHLLQDCNRGTAPILCDCPLHLSSPSLCSSPENSEQAIFDCKTKIAAIVEIEFQLSSSSF